MTTSKPREAAPVTVRWLGVAGVEIAWHGRSLLLDPYFSRLPLRRLLVGRPQPDDARIDAAWNALTCAPAAVAVTHTHADHALDMPALARLTAAPLFGSASLAALLGRAGLPGRVTVCRPGEVRELPALGRLAAFGGSHGRLLFGRPPLPGQIDCAGGYPLAARAYRAGDVLGFDVTIAGRRFVHIGSAGVPDGPVPAGACDVLFLCVPGWQVDLDYPAAFLRRLRPRQVVPVHFDVMTRARNDPRATQPGAAVARWLDLPGFLTRLAGLAPDVPVRWPRLWEPDRLPAARAGSRT